MLSWINIVSAWSIPIIIAFIPLYAYTRKVPVYESFVDGAKDGFSTAIGIIPHLVGMMVAISVFRSSGALEFLSAGRALLQSLGVPSEILPWAFYGR